MTKNANFSDEKKNSGLSPSKTSNIINNKKELENSLIDLNSDNIEKKDAKRYEGEFNNSLTGKEINKYVEDKESNKFISQNSTQNQKIIIPETILKKIIEKYKEYGNWNKVAEEYKDSYRVDIIRYQVKKYLGENEYQKLRDKYQRFTSNLPKKTKSTLSEEILREMIEKYKDCGDFNKVAKDYKNKFSSSLIRVRVNEYLGYQEYKRLIIQNSVRNQKIVISEDTLKETIKKYKEYGNWENVAKDYKGKYSRKLLRYRIKEYLGKKEYKTLKKEYMKTLPIVIIPEETLKDMIEKYRDCSDFDKVAKKYNNKYSSKLIRSRVKEYLGEKEYENLTFQFTRETFIKELIKSLKNSYSIDIDFILLLYKMTDPELSPYAFARALGIYSGSLNSLIVAYVERKTKMTNQETFKSITNFILNPKNKLTKEDQSTALSELKKIQELRRKDFIHRGILYAFHWIEERLNIIKDISQKETLFKYLSDIENEKFPLNIFEDPNSFRASNFCFSGSRDLYLKTKIIEKYFKNKYLINATNKYNLCISAKEIFKKFKTQEIGIQPDHPPILGGILKNNEKALAIEIPVWKLIKNSKKHYVGHIDLLLINGSDIIVADYKQNQAEIFRAILQLTAYGIMLKDQLKLIGFNNTINIKCVGFSKDIAWEFDPEVIKDEIPKFFEYEKKISERKDQLLTVDKRSVIIEEIRKLFSY